MKKNRFLSLAAALAIGVSSMTAVPTLANSYSYNNYYYYNNTSITTYSVKVDKGYLALRTEKAYDDRNIIGELYTGDTVQVVDSSDNTYWYVYAPKLGYYGYVNKNYLVYSSYSVTVSTNVSTVSVASGYLALRTAMAYDDRNIIGELYTGDVVNVLDTSNDTYWYVYSPKHDKNGYVNRNYLVGGYVGSVNPALAVSVPSGYLALRSYKAYDDSNIIGRLHTGDLVQIIDSSDTNYWYVYAPTLNNYGYVNRKYLVGNENYQSAVRKTVSVQTGYLALRTAMAYDERNEIGELYTGDVVLVTSTADSTYWYVYAPSLGKFGYVNKNYLY